MGTIKQTARRVEGKAKEAVAEIIGDGNLQEEAKAEQRPSEESREEDRKPTLPNPFGNLDRLT